jgi:putative membrane protein
MSIFLFGGGIMMFFGGWMMIVWIVVIALIVWGVIVMIKNNSSVSNTYQKRSPLEIANKRYARGEINKEEYEEIKKNLSW